MIQWCDGPTPSANRPAARDLGGQRLLRQDQRVAGLDRDDGRPDLDAIGDLAEQRDGRHRVEVAGHLRDPERRETVGLGGLPVGQQAAQPVRA